jgi:hypothetical protein
MIKYTYDEEKFGNVVLFKDINDMILSGIEENDKRIFDTEAELIEAVDSMDEDEWINAGAMMLYVVNEWKEENELAISSSIMSHKK